MRKISVVSSYSKLFENFLKWILEDISHKIDPSQFGARKGIGTEHHLVKFVDKILRQLDASRKKTAVIAAAADCTVGR